jgi:hypothetical protein
MVLNGRNRVVIPISGRDCFDSGRVVPIIPPHLALAFDQVEVPSKSSAFLKKSLIFLKKFLKKDFYSVIQN